MDKAPKDSGPRRGVLRMLPWKACDVSYLPVV